MRHSLRSTAAVLLLAMLAACGGTASRSAQNTGRSDQLSRDQIGTTAYPDLFELITALRGSWLRSRGPDSFRNSSQLKVYVDDVNLGGVEVLRSIHPMEIEYVRYFDPVQASSRWGFDHGAGVIYVASRRD